MQWSAWRNQDLSDQILHILFVFSNKQEKPVEELRAGRGILIAQISKEESIYLKRLKTTGWRWREDPPRTEAWARHGETQTARRGCQVLSESSCLKIQLNTPGLCGRCRRGQLFGGAVTNAR